MWDVRDVEMLGMWNAGDLGFSRCEILGMWNVRDAGCSGCGIFGM